MRLRVLIEPSAKALIRRVDRVTRGKQLALGENPVAAEGNQVLDFMLLARCRKQI